MYEFQEKVKRTLCHICPYLCTATLPISSAAWQQQLLLAQILIWSFFCIIGMQRCATIAWQDTCDRRKNPQGEADKKKRGRLIRIWRALLHWLYNNYYILYFSFVSCWLCIANASIHARRTRTRPCQYDGLVIAIGEPCLRAWNGTPFVFYLCAHCTGYP